MTAQNRLQLTADQLDEFVGTIFSIEYNLRSVPYQVGAWLTWDDALYNVGSEIGSLTASEIDKVHDLCIRETQWDKGQGYSTAIRKVDLNTFNWAEQ